jgi:integrase
LTSIIKRGKFYWIDYYHDGKRKRQSLKTDKLLEAKDRAKQIEESLHKLGAGPLLSDFAETYFAWARATKPTSAQEEKWRFDKIMIFLKAEGVLTLSAITPLVVEKLRAKLLERELTKATINRYLQLLRGMFYRAADWNLFSSPNPLRKVKFYRESSPIQVPSAEEINRIREAARQISAKPRSKLQAAFSDIVELALNTGLRKSELLHLRWKDIKDGEAYIQGKGDKVRKVPFNQAALAVIERQLRAGEFVFDIPNRNHPNLLRRTVLMAGRLAGVSFHVHLFRHRFATELLERGVDIVTISEILGHSKIATSLIYSHSSRERKRAAVDMLKL